MIRVCFAAGLKSQHAHPSLALDSLVTSVPLGKPRLPLCHWPPPTCTQGREQDACRVFRQKIGKLPGPRRRDTVHSKSLCWPAGFHLHKDLYNPTKKFSTGKPDAADGRFPKSVAFLWWNLVRKSPEKTFQIKPSEPSVYHIQSEQIIFLTDGWGSW